jgi:ketosteroid isomerase-like protein
VEGSGKPFNVPVVHVWEIRDGKAVRFTPFIDLPTMKMSLGEE